MLEDKKEKKEHLGEVNCWGDLWQRNYLDSQINSMMRSIGEDWKEIGDDGKGNEQEEEEPQKQSERKRKKLSKRNQKSRNGQKRMKIKWTTQLTLTINCKNPQDEEP